MSYTDSGLWGGALTTQAFFNRTRDWADIEDMQAAGTLDLATMRIGRPLRVTAITFTVGALALAAFPAAGVGTTEARAATPSAHASASAVVAA